MDPAWEEVFSAGGFHIGAGRTKRFVEMNANQVIKFLYAHLMDQSCERNDLSLQFVTVNGECIETTKLC